MIKKKRFLDGAKWGIRGWLGGGDGGRRGCLLLVKPHMSICFRC